MAARKTSNVLMWLFCVAATAIAIVPLVLVLYYVASRGMSVLNPAFFFQTQKPMGEPGGGMKHAILGSLLMVGIACSIGLPFGVLGGIFLSEFGGNRYGFAVRFAADVLNGIPSIVIGVFVYALAVLPVKHFSAWAGGLALGIMMIPTIMRTTEEIVRLVPMALREGALALGDTRWHATLVIVLGAARGGVITGILLAIARVAGETAPLLFTALGNNFLNKDPSQPTASLPVTIYNFATSADDHWNAMAWGGAFVLVFMILILSIAARYATANRNA